MFVFFFSCSVVCSRFLTRWDCSTVDQRHRSGLRASLTLFVVAPTMSTSMANVQVAQQARANTTIWVMVTSARRYIFDVESLILWSARAQWNTYDERIVVVLGCVHLARQQSRQSFLSQRRAFGQRYAKTTLALFSRVAHALFKLWKKLKCRFDTLLDGRSSMLVRVLSLFSCHCSD